MLTDCKIIEVGFDGERTTVVARFYEGEVTTKTERGALVTRYRRSRVLRMWTAAFPGLKTERAINDILVAELSKDTLRTAIPEQR